MRSPISRCRYTAMVSSGEIGCMSPITVPLFAQCWNVDASARRIISGDERKKPTSMSCTPCAIFSSSRSRAQTAARTGNKSSLSAIADKLDLLPVRAAVCARLLELENIAQGVHDIDVGFFRSSPDIIRLADASTFQHCANSGTVIGDIQPISPLLTIAV